MRIGLWVIIVVVFLVFGILDSIYLGKFTLLDQPVVAELEQIGRRTSVDASAFESFVNQLRGLAGLVLLSGEFVISTLFKIALFDFAFINDAAGGFGVIIRGIIGITIYGILILSFLFRPTR